MFKGTPMQRWRRLENWPLRLKTNLSILRAMHWLSWVAPFSAWSLYWSSSSDPTLRFSLGKLRISGYVARPENN